MLATQFILLYLPHMRLEIAILKQDGKPFNQQNKI